MTDNAVSEDDFGLSPLQESREHAAKLQQRLDQIIGDMRALELSIKQTIEFYTRDYQ